MDCRLFPFNYNQSKQSIEIFKDDLLKNLDENQKQTQITILQSQRDHHVGELDNKDQVDVTTRFEHKIHGIKRYKFLSNTILYFTFHSEIEEPFSGLYPLVKTYREHRTRIITPPKFDRPFVIIFKTDTTGLLLAPKGTPERVEYLVRNLSSTLGVAFNKEIRFTSEKMDQILDKLGKDGDRIKSINELSASVIDNESYEHHNTTLNNIGSMGSDRLTGVCPCKRVVISRGWRERGFTYVLLYFKAECLCCIFDK